MAQCRLPIDDVADLKSLGADEIIDCKRQRSEDAAKKVDASLDTGVAPQPPLDEDQRTIEEIMNEADRTCSQAQILVNNLLLVVFSAFPIAFVWGFSS